MKRYFLILISIFVLLSASCSEDKLEPSNDKEYQQHLAAQKVREAYKSGLMIESISKSIVKYDTTYEVEFSDGSQALIIPILYPGGDYDLIRDIEMTEEGVVFVFTNDDRLILPHKYSLSIIFNPDDLAVVGKLAQKEIGYTVVSNMPDVKVSVNVSSSDYLDSFVKPDDETSLSGKIYISAKKDLPTNCYLTVTVSNGKNIISKKIRIEQMALKVYDNLWKIVGPEGGDVMLEFLSNTECAMVTSSGDYDWISENPGTRSLEYGYLTAAVKPNTGHHRISRVQVVALNENLSLEYVIFQKGEQGYSPESGIVPSNEIWYITESGKPVDLSPKMDPFGIGFTIDAFIPKPAVHTYQDGIGIIKFSWKASPFNGDPFYGTDVTEVFLPADYEGIGGENGFGYSKLKTFVIPESIKYIWRQPFRGCTELEGFYGNDKYHSADHLCFFNQMNQVDDHITLTSFVGRNLTEYEIKDNIYSIADYAFENMTNLKSLTIPASVMGIGGEAFAGCTNFEEINGPQITDKRFLTINNQLVKRIVNKNFPSYYRVPDNITGLCGHSFAGIETLEELDMGDQVNLIDIAVFTGNQNLKKVTLSAGLKDVDPSYFPFEWHPFTGCPNLKEVYLRAPIPPKFSGQDDGSAPDMKIYVPLQSLEAYKNSSWSVFGDRLIGYEYTDLPEIYISTDYSEDGNVLTLQRASKGNGINVVLMGDGYSDRQIASGLYGIDMDFVYRNLFTIEPYSSFKDLFNVYSVTAVSAFESAGVGTGTAFNTQFGSGSAISGDNGKIIEYAMKIIPEDDLDDTMIVVVLNSDKYAGTCYMYSPEKDSGDYGSGLSIAFFPKDKDEYSFSCILHHEANGHGFAKLADEYFYSGTQPESEKEDMKKMQSSYGWFKNIDFTNDRTKVIWSKFLSDPRYSNEGLGIFEGGNTYRYGVWRPTETSIMDKNEGDYNAPSREAIYYRIHKLAYGPDWKYNYEDFVNYDINRTRAPQTRGVFENTTQLAPPVIKPYSWKAELKH